MAKSFAIRGVARPRSPVAAAVLGAVAGLFLFVHWMGPGLLSAGSPFWRAPAYDLPVMLSGYEAVVRAPLGFPPTVTRALVAPAPISIVYTDSIPWLTLLFKATGVWRWLNPLGVFWLASYVLQPVAMVVLLRACGARRLATLSTGAVIALLTPVWLLRHGHVALTAHWILMLALALAVASAREGLTRRRALGFAGLGALAAGVHAYHLPPVALCLLAAMGSEILLRRPQALRRSFVAGAAFTAALALSYWVLGYGVGAPPPPGAGALGEWSMNIVGLVLPQASAVFGQTFDGAGFSHGLDPTGGQAFEGYAYLGLGVLLLIAAACLLAVRRGWAEAGGAVWWRRWGPLTVALVILFVAAVGPIPYLGARRLAQFRLPAALDALSVFRSHGRFIWTVTYALTAAALAQIERLGRPATALALMIAATGLQIADTREVRLEVRHRFSQTTQAGLPAGLEKDPAVQGRPWVFVPTHDCAQKDEDKLLVAQLTLAAVRAGGTSSGGGAVHGRGAVCRVEPDLLRDASPADRRITVALEGADPAFARIGARSDCRDFLRGLICGRGLEQLAGTRPHAVQPVPGGELLGAWRFDEGERSPALVAGWAPPGPNGVWSDGPTALMRLAPPTADPARPTILELSAMSYVPPPGAWRPIEVRVRGRVVARWDVKVGTWRPYRAELPAGLVAAGEPLEIEYAIANPARPGAGDAHWIGLGVQALRLTQ